MTAPTPVRAPTPNLKTPATAASASDGVAGHGSHHPAQAVPPSLPEVLTPIPATAPAPAPAVRRPGRSIPDHLSDRATSAFIRRTLCAQQLSDKGRDTPAPIHELLPPLTSRNDVDLQLYAFISVILREFVQAWYSKITPDETFVAEIVQVIAHCTRTLEQRLRKVDLESLILDELPDLLDRHTTAYRASRNAIARPPIAVSRHEVYHSLCPLPSLSPVPRLDAPETILQQQQNEEAYRQLLVRGVLALLLPTEDLENPCLIALVSQVFSELIIGNVIANKASQPWIIWDGLATLAGILGKPKEEQGITSRHERPQRRRYTKNLPEPDYQRASFQGVFLSMLQWAFLVFASMRFLITNLTVSWSVPRMVYWGSGEPVDLTDQDRIAHAKPPNTASGSQPSGKAPIMSFMIWSCTSNLIQLDARMPWLSGAASMLQLALLKGPGRIASLNGRLDRLLSHLITNNLLDPSRLSPLLRAARAALFPNNTLNAHPLIPPSSDEELLAIRRKCASAIAALLPPWIATLYFRGGLVWPAQPDQVKTNPSGVSDGGGTPREGKDESGVDEKVLVEIEEGILDVFSDVYCNKHLMYSALELILVRIMPELAEKSVTELWEERLS